MPTARQHLSQSNDRHFATDNVVASVLLGCLTLGAVEPGSGSSVDKALIYLNDADDLVIESAFGGDVLVNGNSMASTFTRLTNTELLGDQLVNDTEALRSTALAQQTVISAQQAVISTQQSQLAGLQSTVAAQQASIAGFPTLLSCYVRPGPINVATVGASCVESFVMDGDTYVAFCSAQDQLSFVSSSVVVKWNPATFGLDAFQSLTTFGALACKYFEIQSFRFLMFANSYNGSSYAINSEIFLFNLILRRFVSFQLVPTNYANGIDATMINGLLYIAVANHQSGKTNYTSESEILVFQPQPSPRFVSNQKISGSGASKLQFFKFNDSAFLIIPNQAINVASIFMFNSSTAQFDLLSINISLTNVYHTQPFLLGQTQYIFAASYSGSSSELYQFEGATNALVLIQRIPTSSIRHAEIMQIEGATYLFLASQHPSGWSTSRLYVWHEATLMFTHYQDFTSIAAKWADFVRIGEHAYFLATASYSPVSLTTSSPVSKWCGGRFVLE